jgi:transcriptional antiterminator RfaH
MPILPPEPFSYPENLFDRGIGTTGEEGLVSSGDWFVTHTKSRSEKALARWLLTRSIQFFLPLYKKQVRLNGRTQTTFAPLFPGYAFVAGGPDARGAARASNHVARCIPVHDQGDLEADLVRIHRLMTGDFPLTPVEKLPPGSPVEVIDGPFAGMTGTILRTGLQTRLVVEVRMIRQGVSVDLDRSAVRPLTADGQAHRARIALIRR